MNHSNSLNPGRKPNSKGKIPVHAGLSEFYKFYKNRYAESPHETVDYPTYAKVIRAINKRIAKAIIYEGFELRLPGKLGYISIIRKKHKLKTTEDGRVDTRYLPVDFQATRKLWKELYPDLTYEEILKIPNRKRVFQKNTHTSGFIFKWNYNKFTSNAVNKSVYFFKPSRTNQRELASYIKSEDFQNHYFTI